MMFITGFMAAFLLLVAAATAMYMLEAGFDGTINEWGWRKVCLATLVAFVSLVVAGGLVITSQHAEHEASSGFGFVLGLFTAFVSLMAYDSVKRTRSKAESQ